MYFHQHMIISVLLKGLGENYLFVFGTKLAINSLNVKIKIGKIFGEHLENLIFLTKYL